MNSYQLTIQQAALDAAHEHRRMYVYRSGGEFVIERQYPAGMACVEVQPNGQTREIAGTGARTTFGPGTFTGD